MTILKNVGDHGEELVVAHLLKNKYTILARNYTQKCGEIDVIAQKGNRIFFVEVKTRLKAGLFDLAEVVNYTKQRRIIKTAQLYLVKNRLENYDCQFDVALIEPRDGMPQLTYIPNAFVVE